MNIFVCLGQDEGIMMGTESEFYSTYFPTIYFWFKDHFFQRYNEDFYHTNWDWYDINMTKYNKNENISLKEKLLKNPPDIFCQSIYVWNEEKMYATAKWVKEQFPNCTIVAGGPSAESKERYFKKHPYYDIVVNGPGAEAFSRIINCKLHNNDFRNLKSVAVNHKETSSVVITEYLDRKEDPLILNYASNLREETKSTISKLKHYYNAIHFSTLYIQGCPYSCSFCEQGQELWTKINKRPLEYMLNELELFSNFENSVLQFIDSNFGIHKNYEKIIDFIIETNNDSSDNFLLLGAITYAKENFERASRIQDTLAKNNHPYSNRHPWGSTDDIYLALQDTNKEVLKINGRPFKSEQKKIDLARQKIQSSDKDLDIHSDIILGMPGQSFKSLVDSFVFRVEQDIITPIPPFIYAVFPNTPLTEESSDFSEKYKSTNVFFRNESVTNNYTILISPEYETAGSTEFLVKTPSLSTIELASSFYYYAFFGKFFNTLSSLSYYIFEYLKNHWSIDKSKFLEKLLWEFNPENFDNLPNEIVEDIQHLYKWLSGETKFMNAKDITGKYYIQYNSLPFYRWVQCPSLFLDIFYKTFVKVTGHNDVIFKSLLKWQEMKALSLDKNIEDKITTCSYNYDDIAIKKMPVYYISNFTFKYSYNNRNDLQNDMTTNSMYQIKSPVATDIEVSPLKNKIDQKPLSIS